MTAFALDTSAVVAWITQENVRWRAVDALISNSASEPILAAPALTESIVVARRKGNTSTGARLLLSLGAVGIAVEPCTTPDLVRAAELLETSATNPAQAGPRARLWFGDALILAIAERLEVPIVTGERYWKEFAQAGHTIATVERF